MHICCFSSAGPYPHVKGYLLFTSFFSYLLLLHVLPITNTILCGASAYPGGAQIVLEQSRTTLFYSASSLKWSAWTQMSLWTKPQGTAYKGGGFNTLRAILTSLSYIVNGTKASCHGFISFMSQLVKSAVPNSHLHPSPKNWTVISRMKANFNGRWKQKFPIRLGIIPKQTRGYLHTLGPNLEIHTTQSFHFNSELGI